MSQKDAPNTEKSALAYAAMLPKKQGKRLQDALNSQYIQAANQLRPSSAKHRIVAYVESYDDVFFWRSVLQEFEDDHFYFEVMLPSRTSLERGKKSALMNKLGPALGEYMIACVDADYDWLMQGCTEISRMVCSNPHVLHTYAYAIENYQCYAPNLHTACVMSTLNDRSVLDLEVFMREFSTIVWPLFVWNVWAYRYGFFREFSMSKFCDVVSFHSISPAKGGQSALEALRHRVNKTISMLQRRYPQGRQTYAPLRDELLSMGLTPETTYLYIQGHTLFDGVVMPLLTPVCNILRREREREISRLAVHQTQMQNEWSSYEHSICGVDVMLKKSSGFRQSPPYQLLRADITRLMADVGRQK